MNYKEELNKIYGTKYFITDYDLSKNNIVLYGAGSLGQMACDLLLKSNIMPKYIVDKNKQGVINGVKIITPANIDKDDLDNSLFLICIATISYNEIVNYLTTFGIKNIMQFYTYAYLKFPNLLSNGWFCANLDECDKTGMENVCKYLSHDELSLHHYMQFLWWKLCGIEKVFDEYHVLSGKKFFKSPCMPKLNENEILADCGAHYGQTIESFIEMTNNKFEKIYAFEPDEDNLNICKQKFKDERIIYSDKVIFNKNCKVIFQSELGFTSKINDNGREKEAVTIDSLNINPTIIKIHIEGSEFEALEGAAETIKRSHPSLMVLADHNQDGLYKIPILLYNFGYKLYFNLHDYCGNSAVFYAINVGVR